MSTADERAAQLRAALPQHRLVPGFRKPVRSTERLRVLVQEAQAQADSEERLIAFCALSIDSYRLILQSLLDRAEVLQGSINYWQRIQNSRWAAYSYSVQNAPGRLKRAFASYLANPESHQYANHVLRRLSAVVFAFGTGRRLHHGSQDSDERVRSAPYTPLQSARRKAQGDCAALQEQLQLIHKCIGSLIENTYRLHLQADSSIYAIGGECLQLCIALKDVMMKARVDHSDTMPHSVNIDDTALLKMIDSYECWEGGNRTFSHIYGPPSWATRSWPFIVFGPIAAYLVVAPIWAARPMVARCIRAARETVQGLVVDWVLDPCVKILQTLRSGNRTLALIGEKSLASDLDSLQRMVTDFARDEGNFSDMQLQDIAARVRDGDLTLILKAWEADIKTPFRSAVIGSLLRTLFIQVQKLKCDVALAMDGIERMLRGQSLTIAAVGIAPALLLVFALERLLVACIPSRAGRGLGNTETRRTAWLVMRKIDQLLNSGCTFELSVVEGQINFGRMLVLTSKLREYARNGAGGPLARDARLRREFMEDVRRLEHVPVQVQERKHHMRTMWTSWQTPLGWNKIV